MHPIEHVIYFSAFVLFWVIPVHPVLIVLLGFIQGISPGQSLIQDSRKSGWGSILELPQETPFIRYITSTMK